MEVKTEIEPATAETPFFDLDDPVLIITIIFVVLATLYWYTKEKRSAPVKKATPATKAASLVPSPKIPKQPKTRTIQEGFKPLTIFFGSQTGTAEEFAKKLASEGKRHKFDAQVVDMEDYNPDDLENEKFVMFAVATYGEGEPTDNAREFTEWLSDSSRPDGVLRNVKFTVFGLGNKTYEHYNAIARKFDARLEELGAERVYKRGEGDDDSSLEDDFAAWKKDMWPAICQHFGIDVNDVGEEEQAERKFKIIFHPAGVIKNSASQYLTKKPNNKETTYDAKNPYIARIMVNRELHSAGSDRSCRHIEIETNNQLSYEAGDHLGVYAENDAAMSDELARRLGVDPEAYISLIPIARESKLQGIGPCTVRQAIMQWCDITTPPRKSVLKVLSQYAADPQEQAKLRELSDDTKPQPYGKWIKDDMRTILEVLNEYKSVKIPFDLFLETIPRLAPRYYSISSSMKEHPGSVHITAVIVEYKTPTGRFHQGVATTYLNKLAPHNGVFPTIPVFIHKSTFRTPRNPETPIIMVGPGTGVAPFRGFLYDRKPQHNNGKTSHNVLFFGCRHPDKDYIYREELEGLQNDGHVDLSVAFSRHLDLKVYVQHRITEVEEKLWKLLHEKNAHFYICGDARAMAKDVHQSMVNVIMKYGGKTPEQAENYLIELQKNGRYQTDVWY